MLHSNMLTLFGYLIKRKCHGLIKSFVTGSFLRVHIIFSCFHSLYERTGSAFRFLSFFLY